jgi:hypothetical protein
MRIKSWSKKQKLKFSSTGFPPVEIGRVLKLSPQAESLCYRHYPLVPKLHLGTTMDARPSLAG